MTQHRTACCCVPGGTPSDCRCFPNECRINVDSTVNVRIRRWLVHREVTVEFLDGAFDCDDIDVIPPLPMDLDCTFDLTLNEDPPDCVVARTEKAMRFTKAVDFTETYTYDSCFENPPPIFDPPSGAFTWRGGTATKPNACGPTESELGVAGPDVITDEQCHCENRWCDDTLPKDFVVDDLGGEGFLRLHCEAGASTWQFIPPFNVPSIPPTFGMEQWNAGGAQLTAAPRFTLPISDGCAAPLSFEHEEDDIIFPGVITSPYESGCVNGGECNTQDGISLFSNFLRVYTLVEITVSDLYA